MGYSKNTEATTLNGVLEALTDIVGGVLPSRTVSSVIIPTGADGLSAALDLGDKTMVGIIMPDAWTAADLTFAVSADGVAWTPLYDGFGTEVKETAAAGRSIRLDPAQWAAWRYIKIRSGTAGTPVPQGEARTISIISRIV